MPGLASFLMSLWASKKLPGQPCRKSRGMAPGCGERSCTKCSLMPFTAIMKLLKLLIRASCAGRTYVCCLGTGTSQGALLKAAAPLGFCRIVFVP